MDVNADGMLSPLDALLVINYLITSAQQASVAAAPASSSSTSLVAVPHVQVFAVDQAIAEWGSANSSAAPPLDSVKSAEKPAAANVSAAATTLLSADNVTDVLADEPETDGELDDLDF
jgi:hypothetical protein